MKKVLLSIAALALIGYSANAQTWNFGPKAGVSFSSANGIAGASDRIGGVGGVFAELPVNQWFSIQTEMLYSMQGFDLLTDTGKDEYHLDYITMPVLTKYYITCGLNLQLGASFSYLINSKYEAKCEKSVSALDLTNRYNMGVVTGLGYDFRCGLVLEGRYNLALVNSFLESETGASVRNGSLQFLVGWKF